MKAVVVSQFGSYNDAAVADLPVPVPGAGEVVIRVDAAPVNFVDLIVISGKYQFLPKLPFTPGKGPSGVVHTVGPGVDGLTAGDRVLAMAEVGGYADYCTVPAGQCYRLPDGLSLRQAAAMSLTFDTSWFALRALAWCGRLVVIGFAAGRIPSVKVNYLLVKNIEVTGLQVSDYRKRRPDQMRECYREIFSFLEKGQIAPIPVTELPLSEFRDGLQRVETRKANGRVLLIPPQSGEAV